MTETMSKNTDLPRHLEINPSEIEATISRLIASNTKEIESILEAVGEEPTWNNLVAPLEELDDRISKVWSPIAHLNAVASTPELRKAHDASITKLSEYSTEIGQLQPLYSAYLKISQSSAYAEFSIDQRKVIKDAIKDFELSGVALPLDQKKRFGEVSRRLSEITSLFSNNVLDATDDWVKEIADVSELEGLPDVNIALAAEAAKSRGFDGYALTLEAPSYLGVMDHVENRSLRKEIHEAYVTRASDVGPTAGQYDNTHVIDEILSLRRELASLLGFSNYAELSIERKMARSTDEVLSFLKSLLDQSLPKAQKDLQELQDFGSKYYSLESISSWDIRFLSERLRTQKYSVSQEELRPYFPLEKVLAGMFQVAESLYGVQISSSEPLDKWHEDVRFYEVRNQGVLVAQFYLDPFSRQAKRSGAWMADCVVRREIGNFLQLPVAYLTCNFAGQVEGKPALLTHNEVVTLFHEFGHGLHHMLTSQRFASISGINGVAWDAVELPSQIMENWCWKRESMRMISGHWETGEPIPDALLDKVVLAKNFQSGLAVLRQLEFGFFDMAVHSSLGPIDIFKVIEEVRKSTALVPPPDYDRFPWAFGHVFSGGYAAGYYSYLWAEVLSADAFSAFEEVGIFDRETGNRFLTEVLAVGGSVDALEMFKAFRGREPRIDALLRHSGLK